MEVARHLKELKNVVFDKTWFKGAKNVPLYYMNRGIKEKDGLRYDVTTIPPKMLGKEFVKTQGHHHKGKYGELYMVLKGEAVFLMQKAEKGKITDVYAIKAKKGESVAILPYYAHVTINPSKTETLKMANWVSPDCQSVYSFIDKNKGAAYLYTDKGWIKNPRYKDLPKLKFKKPLPKIPKDLWFVRG